MVEWLGYAKVLIKLVQAGLSGWDAWTSEGIGSKEGTAIRLAAEALEELRSQSSGQLSDMAALHLGVVTQCFGYALGRQWAFNKALVPRGLRLFMSQEQRERAEEIELRVKLAVSSLPKFGASLAQPGDLPADLKGVRDAELLADPLATPYYRALWEAFTNPKLDEGDEARVPLVDLDKGRLGFERDFLLAFQQALASPGGEKLQRYLTDVAGDYRARTLRELLLRDMAGWNERHIFGNLERKDRAEDDPIPFMPLGTMYVEPEARLVKQGPQGERQEQGPALALIKKALSESKTGAVVVKADFGMGKSLTARSLVRQLAQRFLDERTPSSSLEVPVYIQCAKDLTEEGFDLDAFARRAWMREAAELGLKLNLNDPALAPPGRTQSALFLFDGLDEVILGERRLESFFRRIKDAASEHHRFIVFSRPGALPGEQELEGIPVLGLLRWDEQQVSQWLEAWRGLHGGTAPELKELTARKLGGLTRTPILLFMIAQTWKGHGRDVGESQASLYEEFFWQIAQGKHEADRTRHKNIFEASSTLHKQLVARGLVAPEAQVPEAMLWLMGRVAWEATKLEQQKMLEPLRQAEVLTKHGITNLLMQELKLGSTAPDVLEAIQMGLLLSLQAHLRSGEASQLLFGHKSFREYLVARYWADRLKAIARAPSARDWDGIEAPLLGGRLLSQEDRTFEFLLELLDGKPHPKRPSAPFGLTEPERQSVLDWAQMCFVREEPEVPANAFHEGRGRQPALREDRRPWLREAALAIGSSLRGSRGLRQRDTLTLRSMLAWFWLMRIGPIIVARKADLAGASMPDNTLRGADFREANLTEANFSRTILKPRGEFLSAVPASFAGAVLDRAQLMYTDLSGCDFRGASLLEAELSGAVMSGALFSGARLDDAALDRTTAVATSFDKASLRRALLRDAQLPGTSFSGADLTGAYLQGADLRSAVLEGALLSGAYYDHETQWPIGFDPITAGAMRDS
jgi:uncharacterized protein YjbI with pentapeptide repeats